LLVKLSYRDNMSDAQLFKLGLAGGRTLMGLKGQPTVFSRKTPRQERATRTVEAIFEATARVIDADGLAGLTTNAVAKRAGVSIGSLYEYFPNKEAILVAMTRQMLEEDERVMTSSIEKALQTPGADVVREAVRSFIGLYKTKPDVRHAIMRVHIMLGLAAEHTIPVRAIGELIQTHRAEIFGKRTEPLSPIHIFVLVRAVVGILRSAFNDDSPLLHTKELEDEIVMLIDSYVAR
jgi:AcrR family transcriptional regulator